MPSEKNKTSIISWKRTKFLLFVTGIAIYNLKLSRWLNVIKSSRAHSHVNWLQVETDVLWTISVPISRVVMWLDTPNILLRVSSLNPDDGDGDSSQNVGFYLQPIDAAVCLRRFYWNSNINCFHGLCIFTQYILLLRIVWLYYKSHLAKFLIAWNF
jgi:hypothetical protein